MGRNDPPIGFLKELLNAVGLLIGLTVAAIAGLAFVIPRIEDGAYSMIWLYIIGGAWIYGVLRILVSLLSPIFARYSRPAAEIFGAFLGGLFSRNK